MATLDWSIGRERSRSSSRALPGVLVAGTLLYILGTWQGIGLRPDSVIYLGLWNEGRQQAPLYTMLVEMATLFGDPVRVTWWLNLGLLLANLALVYTILRTCKVAVLARVLVPLILLFLPQFFYVHATVLSEPLAMLCLLGTVGMIAYALESGRYDIVVGAGVFAAASVLSRFAAVPIVAAGVLALLLYGQGPAGRRVTQAMIFGAVPTVIVLGWLRWDRSTGGAGVDREFAFNGNPDWQTFSDGVQTVAVYLVPSAVPTAVQFVLFAVLVAVMVALSIVALAPGRGRVPSPALSVARVSMLFVIIYCAFVVLTLFIEHGLHVHSRYVMPVYLLTLMSAAALFGIAKTGQGQSGAFRVLTVILIGLVCLNGLRSAVATRALVTEGNFYQSETWRNSPVLNRVAAFDPSVKVYTNAPVAVRILLRKPAEFWPRHYDYRTGKPHPAHPFDAEMSQIAREVSAGQAIVVAVSLADWREYLATEEELVAALGRRPLIEESDGRIYAVPGIDHDD